MSYKDTLNLPKTGFSMKGDLVRKEPVFLEMWKKEDVYGSVRKKAKGRKLRVLHDGPPYANGHIHMGHVLNKVLKDIVVKFYTMKGFDSPFIPGWDCHGLPVEHQLFKELGISKHDINQAEFRKKARDYALKFVEIQKEEFKRLGVFGDWENAYLTLDPKYEASVVRSFGQLVKEGYIYKDLKPVNWCTSCETALAEAEMEYEERTSPSIYVKFRVGTVSDTYFIIWTTTPWTLLGNVAIAVHPGMEYAILQVGSEKWIMLGSLAEATMEKLKKTYKVVGKKKGAGLEGIICRHPFIERDSKIVLADYVSSEEGTGCVHTAPGHGQEDYITGKKYGLPVIMPVNPKGIFDNTCGEFSGMNVHEANAKILERLKKDNALILAENITHSYPHCWRCKKPIISRATEQYFLSIDHKDLRKRMLDSIKKEVKWHPALGQGRISAMVRDRPDWCLSRQRYWGVPIVAFRCKKCNETILDYKIVEHVAKIIEREGADAWFTKREKELLPKNAVCKKCGTKDFIKEKDIIDVWFESGASYRAVLKKNQKLTFPCELYLEGSDQHRGWFQSSLIISGAIEGRAPYRGVLTHGFVVDGKGKKMSKSLGNVISPQDVMKRYGADILRLWVASSNYQDDVRLSEEILERLADAYRKIRNTFRYLLGNVYDFNPESDSLKPKDMLEIDRWMLSRLAGLVEEAEMCYSDYAFYKVFRLVYNFCIYEISSLYLDISKDRLYTFGKNSHERRSCQSVLFETLIALLKILAPIIPFTTEEARRTLCPDGTSVHLERWHWQDKTLKKWKDKALDEKWSRCLAIREEVLKALESKRIANEIGSPLEAKIVLYSDEPGFKKFLKENIQNFPALFITSQAGVSDREEKNSQKSENLPLWVLVRRADGTKCARCWNFSESVGSDKEFKDICSRCASLIKKGAKKCQKETK
ncbi:MAG: isoleucine--tRNA ligase [Candidatus Omnitrophota bacterium]